MRPLLPVLLALLLGLAPAGLGPRAAADPGAAVAGLSAALLAVMQEGASLDATARFQRLRPALDRAFDFPAMAEAALGRTWRDLTPAERQAAVTAFTDFSAASYASRFTSYGGERFEILGEEPGRRGTVLVKSAIVKADGEAVAIDYLTRASDSDWRIIDVLLEGTYSELAAKRSEFAAVIKNQGFEALLQRLTEKTRALLGPG